ncbi:D-alanyl-D-alanine carboxypeptidase [Streptomyces sp. NPDC094143]|uniref:D-alanyl-D-alanine carboxypeptidase n=1 Tax=Streptomyces sp. NPDC094143 TaxID=3155310 RepID=UPI003316799F
MAGESPDRSKQRESSAEPTSGSAGPVPGARSESADPRLAMAREAKKSSGRAGVDTATRVLSARTAEERGDAERGAGDSAPEEAAEPADAAESAKSVETSGGDSCERGAGGSDGRVREAVAAWVASADGDEKQTGTGADSREARKADAEPGHEAPEAGSDVRDGGDAEAPETLEAAGAPITDAGTDADPADKGRQDRADAEGADGSGELARGDREAADAADETDEADEAMDALEDAQEAAEAAPTGSRGPDGAEEPEADRSATAGGSTRTEKTGPAGSVDGEAAAALKADDAAGGKASGPSPSAAADSTGDKASETAAPRTSGGDAEAEPDADTATDGDTDGAASDADASEADGESRPATDTEPAPTATTSTAATGTTGTATGKTPASNTDQAGPGKADDGKAGDGKADDRNAGTGKADDRNAGTGNAGTGKAGTGNAGTGKAGTGNADGTEAGDRKAGTGEAAGGEVSAPPVDQPTAVFKAVRPPVDQPTTMLKLGGGTKDAAGKTDAPEKDAERTSKFVALKPLDDPAARQPVPPAEATAPVPTVGPERTTQQPLPPKPPLDLLAELTNTPPPPETPLRTAVRRVKIWTPLVLLLVIVFAVVQSVRPLPTPTLELTAKDSYTFEGGRTDIPWPTKGQAALDVQGIGTFGSSGEQKPVPIASVAKVMTAYVILRDHPLKSGAEGPKIDIDQAAEDQSDAGQESTVDVTKGDKITQREALESILIASANNVARLLARWDAGSEKAFVQKMNDAAKDLGMKNTTYTDPSGLNNTTVSTAVDQVKLAKAAMQQPAFREVAAMMSYVDYKGTRHDNWNRLVGSNDVTGIKTGTTTSALGNLVFSAKKDVNGETHRIIGAVVRQPAGGPDNTILGAALHEGDRLIRAAQGALESATILKKGTVVGYADDGLGGRTPVAVTEDVTAVGWAGLSVKLTFAADDLPHTAEAGTKVGTLTVGDGSSGAVKVPVALQEDLVEPGFGAKLTRIG